MADRTEDGDNEDDLFLQLHTAEAGYFDLSHRFTPASIRDQMVRASMLIDRLIEHGWIDREQRRLLVVGAGATGVSTALSGVKKCVETVLIDHHPNAPFRHQKAASSRWISPTLYDWPAAHWSWKRISAPAIDADRSSRAIPLPYEDGSASAAAIQWNDEFEKWFPPADWHNALTNWFPADRGRTPRRFLRNCHFVRAYAQVLMDGPNARPMMVAELWQKGRPITEVFGAVISCTGFDEGDDCGEGNCLTDNQRGLLYRGYKFWAEDDYGDANAGLSPTDPARILISGGGDGALQDFIRILTPAPPYGAGPPANPSELLSLIVKNVETRCGPEHWLQLQRRIQTAEDQASRRHVWSGPTRDKDILESLHQTYQAIVAEIKNGKAWQSIESDLGKRLQHVPVVTFVHRGTHFGRSYAINHFLALLLIEYLQSHPTHTKRFRYRPGQVIGRVVGPETHVCNNPDSCHGNDHQISFKKHSDGRYAGRGTFNVIIIRHGPGKSSMISAQKQLPPVRQLLPYHLDL